MPIQWIINNQKRCCSCKEYKAFTEFHKDRRGHEGLAYSCKSCAGQRGSYHHARRMKEEPDYRRAMKNRYIKSAHNLTVGEYEELLTAQKECAICKILLESLAKGNVHLDHDHATNKRREFLCTNCNRGLGHFQDSIDLLLSAEEYLRKHKK
jgi:ribosomal protein L34E